MASIEEEGKKAAAAAKVSEALAAKLQKASMALKKASASVDKTKKEWSAESDE
jgi:hypothetical protein